MSRDRVLLGVVAAPHARVRGREQGAQARRSGVERFDESARERRRGRVLAP